MNIKDLLDEDDNINNDELIEKAQPRIEDYSAKKPDNMEERKK